MRDRSDRTEFRRNMRSLIQKQAMLPKSELRRLRDIERAARAVIDSEYVRGFGDTLRNPALEALKVLLERKPQA